MAVKTIPRILISADRSSSGKTTLSMGIMAVLKEMGYTVQPFKVALDYIDPEYHSDITGRKCRNLDGYLMSGDQILDIFNHACLEISADGKGNGTADIAVIEGVRGLFEGLEATSDIGSTAQISKILKCPVIMVINAKSMTRSCAALISGFQKFDDDVEIAGVILNNVGSQRHADKAIEAIETYTGIPVVGVVGRNPDIAFSMRDLGLIPAPESRHRSPDFEKKLNYIKNAVSEGVDLKRVIKIGNDAKELIIPEKSMFRQEKRAVARIGIPKDDAFNFYYEDNIDLLESAGAQIIRFSPLVDKKLPDVDALYIGGGNIEFFAEELEQNETMRKSIKDASDVGMPIFGESGGFNYLSEELVYAHPNGEKKTFCMVGALPGKTIVGGLKRIVTYTNGTFVETTPIGKAGESFKAHEFHYAGYEDFPEETTMAIEVTRGFGIKHKKDGIVRNKTVGTFIHFHGAGYPEWAENLTQAAAEYRKQKMKSKQQKKTCDKS